VTQLREWLRRHPTELALTAFLHGELSEAESTEVLHHLEMCGRCRDAAKQLEGASRIYQVKVVGDVPSELLVEGREALIRALRVTPQADSQGERAEALAQFSEVAASYLGRDLASEIAGEVRAQSEQSGLTADEALDSAMPRLAELIGEDAAEELRRQVKRELMGA
jgi:anti-sigma factor RsiW